jgi:hypothetical protein
MGNLPGLSGAQVELLPPGQWNSEWGIGLVLNRLHNRPPGNGFRVLYLSLSIARSGGLSGLLPRRGRSPLPLK